MPWSVFQVVHGNATELQEHPFLSDLSDLQGALTAFFEPFEHQEVRATNSSSDYNRSITLAAIARDARLTPW
jgi:hypothetical protein